MLLEPKSIFGTWKASRVYTPTLTAKRLKPFFKQAVRVTTMSVISSDPIGTYNKNTYTHAHTCPHTHKNPCVGLYSQL